MPKFRCKCGYIFNLSKTPLKEEYLLVPERIMHELLDTETLLTEEATERIDDISKHVLICPHCAILWLQRDLNSNEYIRYIIESK